MKYFLIIIFSLCFVTCEKGDNSLPKTAQNKESDLKQNLIVNDSVSDFYKKLSESAISILNPSVEYVSEYVSILYPNGDVPENTGVCTDVVIRSYRKLGIDLQKEVHEDMKTHFTSYPKIWGNKKPDSNIDHRRVPNLEVFFERFGKKLKVTDNPNDYKTGHIVTWLIGNKLPHIGIVTNRLSADKKRRLIVHNVGNGQAISDVLFKYPITGHYTYEK